MRTPEQKTYLLMAILLGGLAMLGPISIDIFLPAVPNMAADLHVSIGSIELTLTAIFVGNAFGQILYGPLSDRLGRKPVILVTLFLFGATTIAIAQASTLEPILLWRFVQGVLLASGRIIANAAARDQYEGERLGKLISLIFIVSVSASVFNPLLGGILVANFGWQSVFLVMTFYATCLFFAVLFYFNETLIKKDKSAVNPIQLYNNFVFISKNKEFSTCMLSGGFALSGFVAFLSSSSGVANSAFGLEPQTYSFYFAGVISVLLVVTYGSSHFVHKIGMHPLILTGGILQALGGASMLFFAWMEIKEPWVIFAPMAVFVIGFSFFYPLSTAKALTPFKAMTGTASSFLGFFQNLMGAFVSATLAIFIDGTAIPMAIAIAICGMASALIYVSIGERSTIQV